jgi:hypothetical protein
MAGLSLNQWRGLMAFHPYHFFQLADTALVPLNSKCNDLVYESAYINADRVGRREIATAIEGAERLIHRYAGFWPSPRYQEVTLQYPQLGDLRLKRFWDVEPAGRWVSLTLPDQYIQAIGPSAETGAVQAQIVYSDQDGDGLFETATIDSSSQFPNPLFLPVGTTPDQVVVRFISGDCGPVTPPPEITPRSITVDSLGQFVIVLDSWSLVRPVRTSGFVQTALNPTVFPPTAGAPLAQFLNIARRRADPTGTTLATAMAVLTWETRPAPGWVYNLGSTDPAATAQAIARVTLRDARAGIVALGEAVYNTTAGTWSAACDWRCSPPDRVTIRYQAGIPSVDGVMDLSWQIVTARLAAAELARPVCACDGANRELYEWQFDRARTGATNELFQAPIPNPLGTRRGHIFAWDQIVRTQRLQGVYAG